MELYDVVTRLVGPVRAVGETNEDADRLENLKALTDLMDRLLDDISDAARTADRAEASMRKIGQYARTFLNDLR